MLKFLARRMMDKFSRRYDYDVSYMRHMLDVSPAAVFKFNKIAAMAQHGERAPKEALFTARLCGVLEEDCGPCVQLGVTMGREAGVPASDIAAVLKGDKSAMSPSVKTAFEFCRAVLARNGDDDAAREAVRAQWGEAGVIDLTLAMQASRLYPMVKAGLGYAKTCQQVRVEGMTVAVVKNAA